jgi:allophanate hydrolase subunit 2
LTIAENEFLFVSNDSMLFVPSNVTLTNNGDNDAGIEIAVTGIIYNVGTIDNNGKIFSTGTIDNAGTIDSSSGTIANDGTIIVKSGATLSGGNMSGSGAVIDYTGTAGGYTIYFSANKAGAATGATCVATYNGGPVSSGAKVTAGKKLVVTVTGVGAASYTYAWNVNGTLNAETGGTLTIDPLNENTTVVCTVTGSMSGTTYDPGGGGCDAGMGGLGLAVLALASILKRRG